MDAADRDASGSLGPRGRPRAAGGRSALDAIRAEDWLLAVWTALVAPWLLGARASAGGPFDGGRPVDGVLGLVALIGVAVCLASPQGEDPGGGTAGRRGVAGSAAIGPVVGGALLVGASTASALGLAPQALLAMIGAGAILGGSVVRRPGRTPPPAVRRALVTPYILAAGGLFWSAIDGVTAGGQLPAAIRGAAATAGPDVLPIIGFLVAFSAVFYAMLVFAPRQIADREGSAAAWVLRYALFAVSIGLGASWLRLLGG